MRTLEAKTPQNFQPPKQWIPPAEFPAPSNVPLDYRPNAAPAVGAIVMASIVIGIGAVIFGGLLVKKGSGSAGGSSVLSSGAKPAMLASLNLNQNPTGIAKELGGRPSERSVYVPLDDPRFEYVTFSWDEKNADHPSSFYLAARKGVMPDARMQQAVEKRLHGGLENGNWYWFGGSGMNLDKESASIGGHAQLTNRGIGKDEAENPRWKDKLAALWKVALEAAFAIPAPISQTDAFELLGAGHPFSKLATIAPNTTVESAPDTIKRLFPGSVASTFISLDINVSIEHPLFKNADMSWKNEKGGQLQSVHFRPNASWPSRRAPFVTCVEGKLGKPEVRVADYVNKKNDYEFHSGQVRLLVPESMAYVVGYSDGILGPDWVKIINAVNDCH